MNNYPNRSFMTSLIYSKFRHLNLCFATLLLFSNFAFSQNPPRNDENRPRGQGQRRGEGGNRNQNGEGRGGNRGPFTFQTDVPAHNWDIVAGRPTKNSLTLSILAYQDIEGSIAYGTEKGKYPNQTPKQTFKKDEPVEVVLNGLKPNTRYFYQFQNQEFSFTTAKSANTEFTFAIQADSHLDEGTDTDTYKRSLENVAKANSDFLVDLGDTFMCDKRGNEWKDAAANYLAQRYYFSLIGHSVPVFLTLGNHDGEAGWRGGDLFDWSSMMRKRYFPNPTPNDFYSGNKANMQNYFAWEWGDAQFIVLDTFSFTKRNKGNDNWGWTLGKEQYDWLKTNLEKSQAKYKFVFIHHLVGGGNDVARGGSEAAQFWEWGGKNFEGKDEFAEKRPDLAMPIHQLFVNNKVSAVFHGHDHIFVKQDLDGIVYQEVPQPNHRQVDNTRNAEEYGYKSGVIKGSSGVLIVKVGKEKATVSYVRAFPNNRQSEGRKDGIVDYEYEIQGKK